MARGPGASWHVCELGRQGLQLLFTKSIMSLCLEEADSNKVLTCQAAWGGFVQVKVNHVAVGSFCPEVILLSQTSTIGLGLLAGMQISSAKFPAQLHSARIVVSWLSCLNFAHCWGCASRATWDHALHVGLGQCGGSKRNFLQQLSHSVEHKFAELLWNLNWTCIFVGLRGQANTSKHCSMCFHERKLLASQECESDVEAAGIV